MEPWNVIDALWKRIEARDWEGVGALLAEDAVVEWPVTGERIVGRENFLTIQREYPEGWSIRVLRILADDTEVASEVAVPHVEMGDFRAASFWTVRGGVVVHGREYWTGGLVPETPPAWREPYTQPL